MDRVLSPRLRPDGWCCGIPSSVSGVDVAGDGCGVHEAAVGSQELRIGAGLEQARRLLAGLSGRDLTVLLGRALYPAAKPARTLEDLGRELGVVKVRAGVIEKRVVAKVRRRAASAEFAAVAAAAATLRHEVGPVIAFAGCRRRSGRTAGRPGWRPRRNSSPTSPDRTARRENGWWARAR